MEPRGTDVNTFGRRFDRVRTGRGERAVGGGAPDGMNDPNMMGLGAWLGESFMTGVLYVLACVVAALGIIGGLYWLAGAAVTGVKPADWVTVCGWIVGGVALAGLLAAGALLLSVSGRQRRQMRMLAGELADLAARIERLGHLVPDPQVLDQVRDRLDKLDESVAEVAHNCLLDEAGRAEKNRQLTHQQRAAAFEQIRREMGEGQWDRARAAIERFRANSPSQAEQASRLAEELDRRREQAEAEDVAAASRQCDELMSVSAWDRALAAAGELIQKHPDSTAAKGLLARVDRERKVAEEQQRQGLYSQIQRHTSRREWKQAFQVAQRLIGQFPDSIEAEAVKAQLETLTANAEIQHRQGMESAIKDFIKRQRFDEAVGVVEELIGAYPASPQAAVLREQLPRLKERAEEAAREARKRRVQWG